MFRWLRDTLEKWVGVLLKPKPIREMSKKVSETD